MMMFCVDIIKEACKQAWNNKKNYIFLSVTIILTFVIIGFYMVYNDSEIFNKYKNTMSQSANIAFVQSAEDDNGKIGLFLSKLDGMEGTYYYLSSEIQGVSLYENADVRVLLNIKVIPNNVWAYYWGNGYRAELLNGNKNISLKDDEVIICKSLYQLLNNNKEKNGELYLNILDGKKLRVSDVCKDSIAYDRVVGEDGVVTYYFPVFVSENCIKGQETLNENIVVYSKQVSEVEEYAKDFGFLFSSHYIDKQNMKEEIRNSIDLKKIILIALMLILGINMLSSFMNALNERKYEISIRRALGASKYGIILQFLTEAFIVIFVDILISIGVIMLLLSSIKLYQWFVAGKEWVINITSYSVTIYFLCCTFLALFFSVLFSILSTRVEIIKYIKNE